MDDVKYTRQWKTTLERKDDPQFYEHSFASNEARANPRMDDDICFKFVVGSPLCSRGFYLWPLRCFSLFSSKTKISKLLFDLIRSRTVEVGRTKNDYYYYIVPLNHYLFHYLFSKKKYLEVNSRTSTLNSLFMKAKLKFRNWGCLDRKGI